MNSNSLTKDYPALSTISTLYLVIGILMIIISLGGVIYGITILDGYATKEAGIIVIITSIIGGFLFSISFIAYSELIKLLIRIEYNTRTNKDKSIVAESNPNNKGTRSIASNSEYEEWKKKNPGKSINDFYARK
jgi:hypothetical protein